MRKPQYQTIGVLIFGLAVVLVLIYYLGTFQQDLPSLESTAPPLPSDARVEVLGLYYYNTIQNFTLKVPSDSWSIKVISETDQLPKDEPNKTVLNNTLPLAEFYCIENSDTIAITKVGIVRQSIVRIPRDFAIQTLGEIIQKYEVGFEKVRVAKQVTVLSQREPQGAYFMAILPKSSSEVYPVLIYAVFVKDEYAYTIDSKVTEDDYAKIRFDLESIIESFEGINEARAY